MTKETKVGLIVGLLFMVGVVYLLSWVSGSSEQQRLVQEGSLDDGDREELVGQVVPLSVTRRDDPLDPEPLGSGAPEGTGLGESVELSEEPAGPVVVMPEPVFHVVQEGETLYDIAIARYGPGNGEKWKLIHQANKYKVPNGRMIRPGLRLRIPELARAQQGSDAGQTSVPETLVPLLRGRTYKVRSGDTLSEISSRKLGTARRWREIQTLNGLDSEYDLQVGMVLKLPGR